MRKVKLALDQLEIETFQMTSIGEANRGTVNGYAALISGDYTCRWNECPTRNWSAIQQCFCTG